MLLLYLLKNDSERMVCSSGYFNICINDLKTMYKNIESSKTSDTDNQKNYTTSKK